MSRSEKRIWMESCRTLAHAVVDGKLVLEVGRHELRFRYRTEPKKGFVIRRGKSAYAAIIAKSDWPAEVPLLRRVA